MARKLNQFRIKMLNSKFRLINLSWQIIKLSLIYDPFKLSLNFDQVGWYWWIWCSELGMNVSSEVFLFWLGQDSGGWMACLGSFLVIPKHYSNITEVYLNLFKDTLKGVRSKDKKKFASRRKSPNPNGPGSCLGYTL